MEQKNTEKAKPKRRWNPRALYFKKHDMSVFCWLTMEKNEKKKLKDQR
jgi:hypothetical protein